MKPKQIASAVLRRFAGDPQHWSQGAALFRNAEGTPCRYRDVQSYSLLGCVTASMAEVALLVQYPEGTYRYIRQFEREFVLFLTTQGITVEDIEDFNDHVKSFSEVEWALQEFVRCK